jgi:thiol-disulfide isomerase/thioredoxin
VTAPSTEPSSTKAAPPDAASTKPASTEPASTEAASAASTDAASTEAASTEAASETASTEATEAPSMEADSTKAASTKASSTTADSTKADSTKADSTKADSTKAGSTKADSTKAGSTKADSTKADSTKAIDKLGFATRIGLAIVRPRWALSIAGDRRFAGRSGSDLIWMIVCVLLATQLRGFAAAVMLGSETGFEDGMRRAVHVLTRALVVDLAFLVVGALIVWVAAGPRRNLGRAFDLACVAALPMFLVDLAATDVARIAGVEHVPMAIGWALSGIAWAWTGALLALAIQPSRVTVKTPAPPAESTALARRAGLGVVVLVLAGLAAQVAYITTHVEDLRPVRRGDPAVAFALPAIGADGTPGPVVELAKLRGQVVVVDFWATWCGPCLKALPSLEAISKRPGVRVLAINLDNTQKARKLFDDAHLTMTLLADDGETSDRYAVSSIPHTVVIDREGIVRVVARGGGVDIGEAVEQIRQIR